MLELSANNAVPYLVRRGIIPAAAGRTAVAESLGGGVSNIVIRVRLNGDGPDGSDTGGGSALVLKQSLPKLRVAEDWFADQQRIHRERAGIDYVRNLAVPGPDGALPAWTAPAVVDEDRDNFIYVMAAAPGDGVNWKDALLAGRVDTAVATNVGAMLGAIHRASVVTGALAPAELRAFEGLDGFVQLRIDPYHRATAAAHPELADAIEAEARRMLPAPGQRRTLVHGDFSPKNIIVDGTGAAACVWLLDFEVVHLGNPVFDLAFMLNHLTLKAIYRPELAQRYHAAAMAFWQAYLAAAGPDLTGANLPSTEPPAAEPTASQLERDTVRQLGALLLARIDGKSPAEYITAAGDQARARALARAILTGAAATLGDVHRRLADTDSSAPALP